MLQPVQRMITAGDSMDSNAWRCAAAGSQDPKCTGQQVGLNATERSRFDRNVFTTPAPRSIAMSVTCLNRAWQTDSSCTGRA